MEALAKSWGRRPAGPTSGPASPAAQRGSSTTDAMRYFVRDLDQTDKLERGLPCVVRHPDAGGRCERPATMLVYEGSLHERCCGRNRRVCPRDDNTRPIPAKGGLHGAFRGPR